MVSQAPLRGTKNTLTSQRARTAVPAPTDEALKLQSLLPKMPLLYFRRKRTPPKGPAQ